MIQVHYARGCTLAEAFYQSVHGPYQLLIVGDPLCRPWADIPQVSVAGVEPGAVVRGSPDAQAHRHAGRRSARADRFELFVDGQRVAECKPGGSAHAGYGTSWPTAITNCGWWPSGRRRSNRRGGRSSPSGWTTTAARSRCRWRPKVVLRADSRCCDRRALARLDRHRCHPGQPHRGPHRRRGGEDRDSRQHAGAGPVQLRVAGLGDGGRADQRDGQAAGVHGRIEHRLTARRR